MEKDKAPFRWCPDRLRAVIGHVQMTSRQEWPHLSQRSTEALNRMTQVLNKRHAIFSNELIPHTLRAKLITIFEVARQVSTILFRMHIQVDSHVSEERFFFLQGEIR